MRDLYSVLCLCLLVWLSACSPKTDLEVRSGEDVVYYPENNVSEETARRLMDFLKEDGYLDNTGMKVRVEKNADTFYVQLTADTSALRDSTYLALCRDYTATLCREVFSGKTTDIWLCNTDFQPFRKLNCILPPEQRRALSKLQVDGNILYFTESAGKDQVLPLAAFLTRDSFFTQNGGIIAELDKAGAQWNFRFVANSESLMNPEFQTVAAEYAHVLSDSVFDGASVSVHLCDRNLSTVYSTESSSD